MQNGKIKIHEAQRVPVSNMQYAGITCFTASSVTGFIPSDLVNVSVSLLNVLNFFQRF